jgi:hypothetical protein
MSERLGCNQIDCADPVPPVAQPAEDNSLGKADAWRSLGRRSTEKSMRKKPPTHKLASCKPKTVPHHTSFSLLRS